MTEEVIQVIAITLCGKYRLVVKEGRKWIQHRQPSESWRDVEPWPSMFEGGSISGAIKYMNVLAGLPY